MARGYRRTIVIDFDTTQVKSGAKDVSAAMRQLDSDFKRNADEIKKNGRASEQLTLQKDNLTKKVELQSRRVAELQKSYEDKKGTLGEYARETMNAKNNVNNAERQLGKLKDQLAATDKALERQKGILGGTITKFEDFRESAKRAGVDIDKVATGFVAVGAALTGIGIYAGKSALTFEDEMAKIAAATVTSQVPLENLRREVLDVSNALGITASESAATGLQLLNMGLDAEHMGQGLHNAGKLGRASMEGYYVAANALMVLTNAFNLDIKEQTSLVDELAKVNYFSNISLQEINRTLGANAPIMQALGHDHREYLAVISMISDAVPRAMDVNRSFGAVMKALSDPVNLATRAYEELGVGIDKNALRNMGLIDSLRMLDRITHGNIDSLQMLIPGLDGAAIAAMLTGDGMAELEGRLHDIKNSAGFANSQFEVLESTGLARVRREMNYLRNNLIEGGGAFTGVADMAANFLGVLNRIPPGAVPVITTIGVAVGALGGLVKAVESVKRVQESYLAIKGLVTAAKQMLIGVNRAEIQSNNALMASNNKIAASNTKVAGTSKAAAAGKTAVGFASKKVLIPLALIAAGAIAVAIALAAIRGRAREAGQEIEQATQMSQGRLNSLQQQASNIPRYATGTMYHRGGRAVVGDGGPELVDLPLGSKVHTANHSQLLMQREQHETGTQTVCHFAPGSIIIDAKSIKDFTDIVKIFDGYVHNSTVTQGV